MAVFTTAAVVSSCARCACVVLQSVCIVGVHTRLCGSCVSMCSCVPACVCIYVWAACAACAPLCGQLCLGQGVCVCICKPCVCSSVCAAVCAALCVQMCVYSSVHLCVCSRVCVSVCAAVCGFVCRCCCTCVWQCPGAPVMYFVQAGVNTCTRGAHTHRVWLTRPTLSLYLPQCLGKAGA